MDKELSQIIVDLKIDQKAFVLLVDTILENSRLNYSGDGLRIENDSSIFSIIRAFRPEEYINRLSYLKTQKIAEDLEAKAIYYKEAGDYE